MKFTKMQGLGNDYVYVNCFEETVNDPEKLAIAVSDRHFGIGSDGLILITPSEVADCRMDMYNLDATAKITPEQCDQYAGLQVVRMITVQGKHAHTDGTLQGVRTPFHGAM